ncbi:DUF1521 domain-containing protein [Sphingomonas cannabina]|uniref:DUF1521 domain-containing protein n=1 Tax=Sphingomonas cannabina TaxID=2899123 RepID=UPI001F1F901D|nr:DUF1521 domain-containing protein [Sphingomonas cannabina]UIJ46505.1 DUF1521 domain-containing protein [Sphingomonas cannabina]
MTEPVGLSTIGGLGPSLPENGAMVASVVLVDPIAAPADSAAVVPVAADIAVFVAPSSDLPAVSGPPAFEVKAIAIGGILFDLSDGYSLSIDESQSAVFVLNAATGESLLVWGAGNIALDGADAARFWGTTTVELANGTKITLETQADTTIADLYRLDKLTVTQGERAMVITGISEETLGDLKVDQGLDGETIDDQTRDGLVIARDSDGWSDELGNAVTQAILDQTRPGALYGPGKTTLSLGEIFSMLFRAVSYGQVSSLILTTSKNLSADFGGRDAENRIRRTLALYAAGTARLPDA